MQKFLPVPRDLDRKILHTMLYDMASTCRALDLYTLAYISNHKDTDKYVQYLADHQYITECLVRVLCGDFTCYEITRDGEKFLSWLGTYEGS